jgi:hypothetical protein
MGTKQTLLKEECIMTQEKSEPINSVETTGKYNSQESSLVEEQLKLRVLRRIIMKRINISVSKVDPGHWWVEVYDSENYTKKNLSASYGWYPFVDKDGDGVQDCKVPLADDGICYDAERPYFLSGVRGVEGRLNRGFIFDPQATAKTINWQVDDMFHPMVDDGRSDDEVIECIEEWSKAHRAEWAWPATADDEDNCQTFQRKIMHVCGLRRAPGQVRLPEPTEEEENNRSISEGRLP